jgi:putative transferase (TIGR04331 family)
VLPYNKLYLQYKKLYSRYLNKTVSILNNYHGKQYDKYYWEPIIGLYLRRFILNFVLLNKIKKKELFKKVNYKNSNFYKNYIEFVKDDRRYLLKLKNIGKHQYYRIKKINPISKIKNAFNIILPNILVNLKITNIFFQESYFKKNLKAMFSLRSLFYINFLPTLKLENYKIEKKKIFQNRVNLIKINETKNTKDNLLNNLLLNMPINYIENYEIISNEVKKISLSNAIYIDGNEVKFDYVKFYIAELRLNKKKVLTGQHSLRSGIEDFDAYFDYSKSISNYYLTWGWNDKMSSIIKYSSTRVFSSLNKYKKVKVALNNELNICFILCSFSRAGDCLPDNYLENLKVEKTRIALLKEIKKQKKIKLVLKPREGSFLFNNKKKFYNKFSILKDKTRMYEIFGNFNIVIFEKISLGIAECIHLNQPTIFYYPKNLYKQKNKKYNELLYLLKKANIYFDDKNKLLQFLNSKKDISLWWDNKNNLENRKKFLKEFANSFEYSDLSKFKKLV